MDELDSVCLLLDYQYFVDSINPSFNGNWVSACEEYTNIHAPECIAPNKEFAAHQEKLLYTVSETGKKECKLAKWVGPIDEKASYRIKSYFLLKNYEAEYRKPLLEANLKQAAQYFPNDLEKLLDLNDAKTEGDEKIKNYVLRAIDSNRNHKLSTDTIDYIKQLLAGDNESKYGTKFVEPATKILTNNVIHHDKEHEHVNFLVDLIRSNKVDDRIRESVFKRFYEDESEIRYWDKKQFDKFTELLSYDNDSHFLMRGLLKIQKDHGYTPSPKKIEEYLFNLFDQSGKLPTNLMDALFEAYKNSPSHFGGLIVDLVVSDKQLPEGLLKKLVEPLTKIEDPKTALFIGTRLVQNYIDLPVDVLRHFVKFLNVDDENLNILATNLYYQKRTSIPEGIQSELVEALIASLPKFSELQHSKVETILDGIKLTEDQSLRREIQERIFDWHRAGSLEEKISISEALIKKISDKTIDELVPFFKGLLLSQNTRLMSIAATAFENIRQYKEIVFVEAEKELLSFIEPEGGGVVFFELELSGGTQILFNPEQWQSFEDSLNSYSWDVSEYIEQIKFANIKELIKLISFIESNKIGEKRFVRALSKDGSLEKLYGNLLNELIIDMSYISSSDKKALKTSIGYLVDEMQWPADLLYNLIKNSEQASAIRLISILDKLADYNVSPDIIGRNGVTAFEVLKKFLDKELSVDELEESINQIISDEHFHASKDVRTLLKELRDSNSGNERLKNLIDNQYFSEQLLKIGYDLKVTGHRPSSCESSRLYLYIESDKIYIETISGVKEVNNLRPEELKQLSEVIKNKSAITKEIEALIYKKAAELDIGLEARTINPLVRGYNKPLSEWKRDDFLTWRKNISEINDDNIAEVIAVISQGAHNTYLKKRAYPRLVQIVSMLSLFKSPEGGLVQVATGEGKSLIVASFAIINVLEGRHVDIVTSSSVLAKRDVKDLIAFYGQLGVSVSHNIGGEDKGKTGMKSCYHADVVYGDPLHFIGDILRDLSVNVRLGRSYDIVIVDEVDNMFIDQNNMKVKLSDSIPGFDVLMPIFVYIRGVATSMASKMLQKEGMCYLQMPELTEAQKENTNNFDPKIIENESYEIKDEPIGPSCGEYIKNYLTNYTEEFIFAFNQIRDIRPYVVPKHLEQFVREQLPKWIDSLLSSFYYEENIDYIRGINPDSKRYPFEIIAPVDYPNTGVVQYGLQWGDGLHQFLQVKHGITMHPENVVTIFMSYIGFFDKYKGNIFGVTGTLGEEPHHEFLNKVYGVELSVIPTYVEKDLVEFQPIVVNTKEEWQREIADVVKRKIGSQSRAGLIIVETIEEVQSLRDYLEKSGYDKEKIFVYGTAKAKDYNVEKSSGLEPGCIIIATNMAGRGTDIELSEEVLANGGLHVIMGVFSASIRVQDQGFGRAGRKGEPGSAQIIAYLEQMPETACRDVKCLELERADQEIQKLEEDRLCKLPFLGLKDRLFDLFIELRKEIDSPTNYKLILGKADKFEEKSLYLYEEDDKVVLRIVPAKDAKKKNLETFDITGLLDAIDPHSTKHIRSVLSGKGHSSSSLNKQDYEIIHFIAAVKGFTDYPEIYNRVNYAFNNLIYDERVSGNDSRLRMKENYLSLLLKNDTAFVDLQKGDVIDEIALEKAELRKKYDLWIKDRKLYNNQYELQQLSEYWGIWLKTVVDVLEPKNCQVANDEQKKQMEALYKGLSEESIKEFSKFREEIDARKERGEFFKNPNDLVLKSWQLYNIAQKGVQKGHKIEWQDEEEKSSGSWYSWMPSALQEVVESVFEYFEGEKRTSFGPGNYVPKTPLNTAKDLASKAIELDEIYGWAAHNARACIELRKDGSDIKKVEQAEDATKVKQNFYNDESTAIEKINNWIIPAIDSQLVFLQANKMVSYDSDLMIQLIVAKEIYKGIVSKLQNNIKVITESSGEQGIRIKGFIPSDEFIKDVNITEAVLNFADGLLKSTNRTESLASAGHLVLESIARSLNFGGQELASANLTLSHIEMSGGFVFEISAYDLEKEEKDWSGTLLAVAVGIASIYTGLWLINLGASSIFTATLGSSLVMQGAGDLVQSVIAVGTGNPIDLKNYWNVKGMSMGISLATAGTLHFLNMIPAIQSLGYLQGAADGMFNAAQSPAGLLATTFATQGTTAAVGAVLQNAGKTFIDPEKIEAEAGESIDRIIASESNRESLAGIYATDEFNGNQELQRDLYREIEVAVSKERWKFHDDKTTAGVGFGTNVASHIVGGFGSFLGMHNVINAGVHLTMGAIKNSEAVGKISGATDKAIKNLKGKAMSSGEMLERLLTKNVGTGNEGRELYEEFRAQGYVANGEIDYKNCDKLVGVKLSEKFADYRDAIVGNCKRVAELLLTPRSFDELKQKYVSALKGLKIDIQKSEILAPAAQALASQFGQVVGEKVGQQAYAKGKAGVGGQTREANQEEIAQKSGLNRKPSEKESGQGQGDNNAKGETPGWTPVEREVLIAKDGAEGIRTGGFGVEEGENVRYTTSKVLKEINGKIYEVSTKSMEILGADGSTVLKREIYGQGIEVKGDAEGIGISFGEFRDGVLLSKLEPEATFDRFSFHEKIDLANNIHEQKLDHWNSLEGSPVNWNDEFNFDIKVPEAKPQYHVGTGMPGAGLLSMEDAKLVKEFLHSEEFKTYMTDVGEGIVEGFVDMGKDTLDLAKIAARYYGLEPSGATMLRIALAIDKFRTDNAGREWEVISEGLKKAGKEMWRELVEATTTGKGHGRILAEAVAGGVIRKTLKGLKTVEKVVDEVMDAVPDVEVCPRKVGLGDKSDIRPHVEGQDLWEKDISKTKIEVNIVKAGTEAGSEFKHHIDIDADLLKREIILPDDVNNRKLRMKFDAHKDAFGMDNMNFNKQNAELFKQKMVDHINNPDTISIAGTYRGTEKAVHYFNPKTEINIMKDLNGEWISGWKLDPRQVNYLKKTGNIQ